MAYFGFQWTGTSWKSFCGASNGSWQFDNSCRCLFCIFSHSSQCNICSVHFCVTQNRPSELSNIWIQGIICEINSSKAYKRWIEILDNVLKKCSQRAWRSFVCSKKTKNDKLRLGQPEILFAKYRDIVHTLCN